MGVHAPRRSDAPIWDHTGKIVVSRMLGDQSVSSVTLPDDMDTLRQRVADLEARPIPVGRAFMIAATGPLDLNAGRVMSTISGWRMSTDGGLRGISIADAGFLVQPGAAYILMLSDLVTGPLQQPGLRFQLQRSALIHGEFDRPLIRATPSSYQTMWPYLADMYPNDILVVNAANTNQIASFTMTALRAVWIEIAH